ncbi:MAG: glucuronate isomerase [Lachnospiraceae bacterium]|nr:glucuronate isomerase [Lachnospiraceae bacterium]
MKAFMDKDFILETETAKHLFHDYAENLPLIDYHCHLNPQEIYEDRRFHDIGEVWLGGKNPDGSYYGDHYKWRILRANGIKEADVTDAQDPFKRFEQFAEALELCIGNPMYHWCNLELKKYFGVTEPLSKKNAKAIWDQCNDKLQNDPECSVRGLIRQSNVAYIGTTDDPVDSLKWHEKIAADPTFTTVVRPSFRPDKAVNITKAGWKEYMGKLAASVGKEEFASAQEVLDALVERIRFFKDHGCVASDHGLDYVMYRPATMEEVEAVFAKAMAGEKLTVEEAEKFQTAVLLTLGRAYHKYDIAMEIHYSCLRNVNERMFALEGADTGYDVISQNTCGGSMAALFSALDATGELPKTIVFSLNPADNAQIATIIGAFQSDEMPGKIQHGPAWWFNDTKSGMEEQMKSLANLGILGNFIGMLTDSRSFLSYTRHDYFRRIMCNLIGNWVENGEYPNDEEALKRIVEGISYTNAKRHFGL